MIMSHTKIPFSWQVFASLRSPLFFMVSGYFAKDWPFFEFVTKGMKRLLIPMLVTNLVMIPIVILFDYVFQIDLLIPVLKSMALGTSSWCIVGSSVFELSAGPLWFVWASILIRIYWAFLQKWGGNWVLGLVIMFLAIFTSYLKTYFTLPFSILSSFGALGFFYAGFIIKKFGLLDNEIGKKLFIIGLACLVYCVGFSHIDINFCFYGAYYIVDLAGCIAAFFILHKVIKSYYYSESRFWKFVQFIGRYSLVALCVHSVDQCLFVHWLPFKFWSFFTSNFELVCAFFIRVLFVFAFTYLISKNKFLCERIFFIK